MPLILSWSFNKLLVVPLFNLLIKKGLHAIKLHNYVLKSRTYFLGLNTALNFEKVHYATIV